VIAYHCGLENADVDVAWEKLDEEERNEIEEKKWKPTRNDLNEVFIPDRKIIAPGLIETLELNHVSSSTIVFFIEFLIEPSHCAYYKLHILWQQLRFGFEDGK
jgi:hypothetical protein